MGAGIPADVANFIAEAISSVEQLEILMLLRREADRSWTAEEIDRTIRSARKSVEQRLNLLVGLGLAEKTAGPNPRYRYAARSPSLDSCVAALAQAYQDYPTAVIEKIFSRPLDKVMDFAKAFQFKQRRSPPSTP